MERILISDTTLTKENGFSFKERTEIVRQLDALKVDVIELPDLAGSKEGSLFIKTVSSFVKNATLSFSAGIGSNLDSISEVLSPVKNKSVRLELPLSPVGMEYVCHKKAPKMLAYIEEVVKKAKTITEDVEFCALDATRTEVDFLLEAVKTAVNAGATKISIYDDSAEMLPDDFAGLIKQVISAVDVPVGVLCNDKNGMGIANSVMAVKNGAKYVKVGVHGEVTSLEGFCQMVVNCGNKNDFETAIKRTELHRIVKQIVRIYDNANSENSVITVADVDLSGIKLDVEDDAKAVATAVKKLGYDLSKEDSAKVYEEFLRVAKKKTVGPKELDAIVASTALQVPQTYKLINFIVNTGNQITTSAQVTLEKNGKTVQDVCMGDGPVDAAFLAIEKIIGQKFELDDFQIQSVTEGKEALASTTVRLRSNGKLYSGNGISTDIISASIRAYISAVNKIIYEENN